MVREALLIIRVLYSVSTANAAAAVKSETISNVLTAVLVFELTVPNPSETLLLGFAVSDKTTCRVPASHGHRGWARHEEIINGIKNIVRIGIGYTRNESVIDSGTIGCNGNKPAVVAASLLSESSNHQNMTSVQRDR